MFLGSKKEVLTLIRQLTEEQSDSKPLRIAVAFWGEGAQALIIAAKQYQIICNLTSGGTNPLVIRDLRAMTNVQMRHLGELHAKVVLADKQAIVGSANFSANGLGLGAFDENGWLEAAALIDAVAVIPWFEAHWQRAVEVSDESLALAAQAWAERNRPNTPEAAPLLLELDLFKPTITGGNMIRMAARPLEVIYFQEIEQETKRSVWNPAYAASVLWTTAGNRIHTKIEGCQYFETPSDVLARAKHAKTIEKVHSFIVVLSRHKKVSPAIRYWALRYLQNAG